MIIDKNTVVQFHYHLRNEDGSEIETSRGGDPMAYLHGHNNVIKGMESAMAGKEAGDVFSATIPPEQGYGARQENAKQRIPVKHLIGVKKPKVGQMVQVQTDKGPRQVTVEKVGRFNVDVDTNHPLAGKTLVFDVEIISVRAATADEISHKHAHGVGGHQHWLSV